MSSNVRLYGIKNCDTVQKSIKWLAENKIDSEFYDLKKETLPKNLIDEWLDNVGVDKLINKRSLTWRNIPEEDKRLNDRQSIIKLIQDKPTVVKRPVMFNGFLWTVGFKADDWNNLFK